MQYKPELFIRSVPIYYTDQTLSLLQSLGPHSIQSTAKKFGLNVIESSTIGKTDFLGFDNIEKYRSSD